MEENSYVGITLIRDFYVNDTQMLVINEHLVFRIYKMFKNTFTNYGGGVLTLKQERNTQYLSSATLPVQYLAIED